MTTTRNANDHFGSHNGSEDIYSCRPFPLTYTDEVKALVHNCSAYWFIDLIISHQEFKNINCQPFHVWKLERFKNDCFNVVATEGNKKVIARQFIPYSDFSYDVATIWLVNGTLLLPTEY